MAAEQHPAQVVGNAFVQQYYYILHQSPELVHRFYQETSRLARPDDGDYDGPMTPITTMQAINEKILSFEYIRWDVEIKTVDAQESLDGGVIVLVTGYFIRDNGMKKNFTQSFFLATQENGYFVLNDIFRYLDESDTQEKNENTDNVAGTNALEQVIDGIPPPLDYMPKHSILLEENIEEEQEEQEEKKEEEEEISNVKELYNPSDLGEFSAQEEVPNDNMAGEFHTSSEALSEANTSAIHEEPPKRSYASIVKVTKENLTLAPTISKTLGTKQVWQVSSSPSPSSPTENASTSSSTAKSDVVQESAVGFSIYIKNLPFNATSLQLEEQFKQFGPIKPGGIQVRSQKQQGICFGFVEFEVKEAVHSAIAASPVMIGGRTAYIEEKLPARSRVSTNQYAPRRGDGFHGRGARVRAGYSGRGYRRGDDNSTGDFQNRTGGREGTQYRGERGYPRTQSPRMSSPGGFAANAFSKDARHWVPTS